MDKPLPLAVHQVFVYTPDQDNLFAHLVAALDSKKVNIFDAQIMTNKDGYAMDTFVVLEQNGEPVTSPSRLQSLKRALETYLLAANRICHAVNNVYPARCGPLI